MLLFSAGPLMHAQLGNSQVLISEIMYHPQELDLPFPDYSDREDAEFIELWNSGNTAMDISNYLIDGINYIFPEGSSIPAGSYLVLAKDESVFQMEYGFSPFDEYCGELSNNGESIRLIDNTGVRLHKVSYKQAGKWPELADGLGHSLELVCTICDVESYENWNISLHQDGHTAGNSNSQYLLGGRPKIDSVVLSPIKPNPGQAVVISVFAEYFSSGQIEYSSNYNSFQTLNGTVAGASITFTIPGQVAHTIIRYRITINNQYASFTWPRNDGVKLVDSYVVNDPNQVPSNYPILNWYYDSSEPDTLDYNESVFEYNGDTYTNTYVWWRRNKHWRVEMPQNTTFFMDSLMTFPLDEFQLNRPDHTFTWWVNGTMARTAIFTQIIGESGEPAMDAFNIRVDENGEPGKIWTFLSWPDGNWRNEVGLEEEGSIYVKFASTSVIGGLNPEMKYPVNGDTTAIWDLISQKDQIGSHLMDVYDIPGMVNFAALSTLICHWDAGTKNFYMHRKPNGRWDGDIWDVDASPRTGIEALDSTWCKCAEMPSMESYVNPFNGQTVGQHPNNAGNVFAKPLLENVPRVNEMYERRLRTLVDKYYAPGVLINRVLQIADPNDSDIINTANSYAQNNAVYKDSFALNQQSIYVDFPAWQTDRYNAKAGFPSSATGANDIVFNEIQYAPIGGEKEEFIELYNKSSESVDLSGWNVGGVGLTLPPGTVILANDYLVIAQWTPSFIDKYGSGKYVAADFVNGRLSNDGETLKLLDATGQIVDSIKFEQQGWHQAHGGPSLERIDPQAPTSDPNNWAPSISQFGTPDAQNNPSIGNSMPPPLNSYDLVINEIMYDNRDFNDVKGANLEFIELHNCGTQPIDLSNVYFNNSIDYIFPVGSTLSPNAYIVLSSNKSAFELIYEFQSFGEFNGKLDNAGEKITLYNPTGYVIDSLSYSDEEPWPQGAEGSGNSIALTSCTKDNSIPEHWSIQSVQSTPGSKNIFSDLTGHFYSGIVINEIHYNPHDSINNTVSPPDTIDGKKYEFIELKNISHEVFDLTDVLFSRGISYVFPAGSSLQPGEIIVLAEDKSSFLDRYGFAPFDKYDGQLGNGGETLWLSNTNGVLLDVVTYDDVFPWDSQADGGAIDYSLALIDGEVDNDTQLNWQVQCQHANTPGAENDFGCFTGLDYTGLTINELFYNPSAGSNYEFIEITNHSNVPMDLDGISIENGIFYYFDSHYLPGVSAAPLNSIVLAKDSASFHNTYGYPAHGSYNGVLSNSGETIKLQDLFGEIIDEVTYDDVLPWDPIADQGTKSLALLSGNLDNNLASSWCTQDVNVTPKAVNTFADVDNDGVLDCQDECPGQDDGDRGLACDDADPCTTGETYDSVCNCTGGQFQDADGDGICDANDLCPGSDDTIDTDNNGIPDGCDDCADEVIEMSHPLIDSDTAANVRIMTNGRVVVGYDIDYHAAQSVELMHDFEVEIGSVFHAYISPCY